jgi:hypothetical protein
MLANITKDFTNDELVVVMKSMLTQIEQASEGKCDQEDESIKQSVAALDVGLDFQMENLNVKQSSNKITDLGEE